MKPVLFKAALFLLLLCSPVFAANPWSDYAANLLCTPEYSEIYKALPLKPKKVDRKMRELGAELAKLGKQLREAESPHEGPYRENARSSQLDELARRFLVTLNTAMLQVEKVDIHTVPKVISAKKPDSDPGIFYLLGIASFFPFLHFFHQSLTDFAHALPRPLGDAFGVFFLPGWGLGVAGLTRLIYFEKQIDLETTKEARVKAAVKAFQESLKENDWTIQTLGGPRECVVALGG